MIFLDSRYVDGTIYKAYDARNGSYQLTVSRNFPSYYSTFFNYDWVETDRLDDLALQFLGSSDLWWQILDINPEILDPFAINPGTQIRIPRE
jgi:hypothetical protein